MVGRSRSYLAWSWVLITAGVVLAAETARLPFTAGSPPADLLVPISAFGCSIAAVVTAWKALRRAARGSWSRILALASLIPALLVAAGTALSIAFIYIMCGFYWARDTC